MSNIKFNTAIERNAINEALDILRGSQSKVNSMSDSNMNPRTRIFSVALILERGVYDAIKVLREVDEIRSTFGYPDLKEQIIQSGIEQA